MSESAPITQTTPETNQETIESKLSAAEQGEILTSSGKFKATQYEGEFHSKVLYPNLGQKENVFKYGDDVFELDPDFEGLARFRGYIQEVGASDNTTIPFTADIKGIDNNGAYIIEGLYSSIIKKALLENFLDPDGVPTVPGDGEFLGKNYTVELERVNVIYDVKPAAEGYTFPQIKASPEIKGGFS